LQLKLVGVFILPAAAGELQKNKELFRETSVSDVISDRECSVQQ